MPGQMVPDLRYLLVRAFSKTGFEMAEILERNGDGRIVSYVERRCSGS